MQIRDNRQGNWLWIDNSLIDDFDLTPYQLAVYVGLARFADNREQSSFPSIKTLTKRLGMSESACRRALQELARLGLVGIEKRYREDGAQTSNVYTLLTPPVPKTPPSTISDRAPLSEMTDEQDPINNTHITSVGVGEKEKTNPVSMIESKKIPSPDDNREAHPDSLAALITAGVTQSVAQELAATCDPAAVTGWCTYVAGARGIKSPAGLIVARLKAGEPPPDPDLPDDDPRRYISGEFADLIQH